MGDDKGLFYYHLIATYATLSLKTAIFGRFRGIFGAQRLKTLSKNAYFLFNF